MNNLERKPKNHENNESSLSQLEKRLTNLENKFHPQADQSESSGVKERGGGLLKSINEISKSITSISGAIAGTTFVFYALGFVIVNQHLLAFGVREFDIARQNYLTAGIVFLIATTFPVLFPLMIFSFFARQSLQSPRYSKKDRKGASIFGLIAGIGFCVVIQFLIVNTIISPEATPYLIRVTSADLMRENVRYFQNFWQIILITLILFGILTGYVYATSHMIDDIPKHRQEEFRKYLGYVTIPFIAIFFLYLLVSWGRIVYPRVSPSFGGGQPVIIQVLVTDEAYERVFNEIGISVEERISKPLRLIDDSGQSVTVLNEDGNALKLDKTLFNNIIYLFGENSYPRSSETEIPSE